jgi:hypothetical protein
MTLVGNTAKQAVPTRLMAITSRGKFAYKTESVKVWMVPCFVCSPKVKDRYLHVYLHQSAEAHPFRCGSSRNYVIGENVSLY